MNRIFAVPYNGSTDLIDKIFDLGLDKHIFEFFGSDMKFRNSRTLLNPSQFIIDVKRIIDSGIEFNYLLNSISYEDYYLNIDNLLEHLKLLEDIGVKTLTVVHPELVDIISAKGFKFFINSSVNMFIRNVEKVDLMVDRGYHRIVIAEDNIRDIKLIEKICNHTDIPVEVMINNGCLTGCIDKLSHVTMCGTIHPEMKQTSSLRLDWRFRSICRKQFRNNPELFIRATWIRPEDIKRYLNCGVKLFKLTGRNFPTDTIVKSLKIYSEGKHEGNIFDYIVPFMDSYEIFGHHYIENSSVNNYFEHIFSNCDNDINCPTCNILIKEIISSNHKD